MNTQNKRAMFAAFFTAAALGLVAFVSVDLGGEAPDHSADAASTGGQDKTLVGDGGDGGNEHDADAVGNSYDGQKEILPDEDPRGGDSHENGDDAQASDDDLPAGITPVVPDTSEDEALVTLDDVQQKIGERSDVPDAGNLQLI